MRGLLLFVLGGLWVPLAFSQSCLPAGITFTAQSQVDQFPLLYPGCVHILGSVTILGAAISDLDSLHAVEQVDGDLYVTNNDQLQDLQGLRHLERVGGAIRIQNNPLLEDLDGLDRLRRVEGDYFYIGNNTRLHDLQGLHSLDSVMGLFQIWGLDSLLDLDGLDALRHVGNDLHLFQLPHLVSIGGFGALSHLGGALRLTDNAQLADISGFNHPVVIDGPLVITQNPQLGECAVRAVCDYLASPAAFIAITDNGAGCQGEEEVKEDCLTHSEDFMMDSPFFLFPNPARERVHLPLSPEQPGNLMVWNGQGQMILHVSEARTMLEIGHWPTGIYWVNWQSPNAPARTVSFIKQ